MNTELQGAHRNGRIEKIQETSQESKSDIKRQIRSQKNVVKMKEKKKE